MALDPNVSIKLAVLGPLFVYWVVCARWAWKSDNTDRFQLDAAIKEEEELAAEETGKKKGLLQWVVIGAILAYEFWQLMVFTWSPETPWSFGWVKDMFQLLAFFLTGDLFLIFFWVQLMLYVAGAIVFVITQYPAIHAWAWQTRHNFEARRRKKRLAGLKYIAPARINSMNVKAHAPALGKKATKRVNFVTTNIAPLTGQFLYEFFFIPALKWCLEMYDCNYNFSPPGLNQAPLLECWSGAHFAYAFAALLQIAFIYPMALLWMLKKNSISADWIYLPRFDISLTVVMFYLCAITTYLSHIQILISVSLIITMGILLVVNYQLQPCLGVGAVTNHWRTATFIGALWSALMALITVIVNNPGNHGTSITFFILVVPIMVAGYFISKRKSRIMDQETFDRIRNITAESSQPMKLKVAKDMVIMSLTPEKREAIIAEGALTRLVVLLKEEDTEILLPATQVLSNIMSDTAHTASAEKAGMVELLVKRLQYTESGDVQARCARASAHYIKHASPEGLKQFLGAGAIQHLAKLIDHSDPMVVRSASSCLTILAQDPEQAKVLSIHKPSILGSISVMMRLCDDEKAVRAGAVLLLPLLEHGDERARDEFESDGLMSMCAQLLSSDYEEATSVAALNCLRLAYEKEPEEYEDPDAKADPEKDDLGSTMGSSKSLSKRSMTISGSSGQIRTLKKSTSDLSVKDAGGKQRTMSLSRTTGNVFDAVSGLSSRRGTRGLSIASNMSGTNIAGPNSAKGSGRPGSPLLSARSARSAYSDIDNRTRHFLRQHQIAREVVEPCVRILMHHGSDRKELVAPAKDFLELVDAPNLQGIGPSLMSAFVEGHQGLQEYVAAFLCKQLDSGISSPDEYSQQDKTNLADFVRHCKHGELKTQVTELLQRLDLDSYEIDEALAVLKSSKVPLVRLMALRCLARHSAIRTDGSPDGKGGKSDANKSEGDDSTSSSDSGSDDDEEDTIPDLDSLEKGTKKPDKAKKKKAAAPPRRLTKDQVDMVLRETRPFVTSNMNYVTDVLVHDIAERLILVDYETTSCLNILAQPPPVLSIPSMRTLTRKMYASNDERLKCQKYNLLSKLKPLLKGTDAAIQREACKTLANYVLNKDILQSVIKDGILEYLLPILQRGDTATQRTILNIIANLGGTLESRQAIIASGYIDIALAMLIISSDRPSIRHICRGLGNLCISPDTRKKAQPLIEPQLVSFVHLWTFSNPTEEQASIQHVALKALQKVNKNNPLLEKHGVEKLAKRKLYNDAAAAIESGKAFVERPRVIHVFRNGDKFHQGVKIVLNKTVKNFTTLLDNLTKQLRLSTGPVRILYKHNFTSKATSLEHFIDGHCYIAAAGGEKCRSDKVSQRFRMLAKDLPAATNTPPPVATTPTPAGDSSGTPTGTDGPPPVIDGTAPPSLPGAVDSSDNLVTAASSPSPLAQRRAKPQRAATISSAADAVRAVNRMRMRSVSGASTRQGAIATPTTSGSKLKPLDSTPSSAANVTKPAAGDAVVTSTPSPTNTDSELQPLVKPQPLPNVQSSAGTTTAATGDSKRDVLKTDSVVSVPQAPSAKDLVSGPGGRISADTPTAFQGDRPDARSPKPAGAAANTNTQRKIASVTTPPVGRGGKTATASPAPSARGGRGGRLAPIRGGASTTTRGKGKGTGRGARTAAAVSPAAPRRATAASSPASGRGGATSSVRGKGRGKGKGRGGTRGRGR